MLQYLDELRIVLKKSNLTADDIVIVGSGALTIIGGRKNGDIEFSLLPHAKRKISFFIRLYLFFFDHYDLGENVDIFSNRYLGVGVKDSLLTNEEYLRSIEEFRIVRPEVELAYKHFMRREKDLVDIKNLEKNEAMNKNISWDFFHEIQRKKRFWLDGLYCSFRADMWILKSRIRSGLGRIKRMIVR